MVTVEDVKRVKRKTKGVKKAKKCSKSGLVILFFKYLFFVGFGFVLGKFIF